MKKIVVGAIFFLFAAAGIIYFLNADPVNSWTMKGGIYCNKRFAIYLENEPNWAVRFPPAFHSSSYLLILEKETFAQSGFAKIVVTSLDSLTEDNIRITNPSTYLQMSINPLRREYSKFEELQSPVNEYLDGREVAKGQFLVARRSSDEPIVSLNYGFIYANKGCSIIYFASPDQYEENLEEAMGIIRSFKFGKEAVKDEKLI